MIKKNQILKILLLPLGLLYKLFDLARSGSRDIINSRRFSEAQIDSNCCIDSGSKINSNVHILGNCLINNSEIYSYTYIGRNSIVQNAKIGHFCSIANDVFIGLGKHPLENFSTSTIFYRSQNTLKIRLIEQNSSFKEYENIEIGHDVWIGTRSIILDGVKVGTGAVIAANSIVTKDVPPYAIVAGVPARIIKYRFSDDKINKLLKSEWWNDPLEIIKSNMDDMNSL
jgi:acetyltransferase-like isoleucine patch superfamily enzyme